LQKRVHLGSSTVRAPAGTPKEARRPNLGLPAADAAAVADATAGIHGQVTNLTAVSGHSHERPALDDDTAADPDLPGDEQDMIGARRYAAPDLGQRTEIGFIGHRDRDLVTEDLGQPMPERLIRPAEIGSHRDETVRTPDDAGHGHADADLRPARRSSRSDGRGELGQVVDDRDE
jgi:hypothetical protein